VRLQQALEFSGTPDCAARFSALGFDSWNPGGADPFFARDGRIEIDSNLCENAIRPTAVGKNYPQLSVMRSCLAA
jgi:hypothetical protein